MVSPVSIVADENLVAAGFSVIEEFRDYSGNADADISGLFELVSLGNEVQLRLKPGGQLANNRIYHVDIDGIGDPAGNLADSGGGTLAGTNPATGVDAIRFDFGAAPEGASGQQFFREIDVLGTPTAIGDPINPEITSISVNGSTATMTFSGKAGTTYACKSSPDLTGFTTDVTPASGSLTAGDNGDGTGSGSFSVTLSGANRFFRLEE